MYGRSSNANLRSHYPGPTAGNDDFRLGSPNQLRSGGSVMIRPRQGQAHAHSASHSGVQSLDHRSVFHGKSANELTQRIQGRPVLEWRHKTRVIGAGPILAGLCTLFAIAAASPAFAQEECLPDDITVHGNCPGSDSDSDTYLHVHYCPQFSCYRFYRKPCTGETWTLIYEGPSNEFCDTEYAYGECVIYKCLMLINCASSTGDEFNSICPCN